MSTALFVYILASAILSSLVLILVLALGTNEAAGEKLSSYECGFEPFSNARDTFDITFYLVGLLFLIFDIEIAFLFPWAVLVLSGSKALLWLIFAFSFILIAGFILEMKLGVLDWKWKSTSWVVFHACASVKTYSHDQS
jgi:NADH-quinone oxidoreductase subunit A